MAETFRPIGDRVLVRRDPVEQVTRGGIVIPEFIHDREHPPEWGTVLAIGSGSVRKRDRGWHDAEPLAVGDRVLVGRFTGHDLEVGGAQVLISRRDDILAVEGE